ncbi:MAG: S8 family serine peptidase [Candidatus Omnitrophica bacterium]|nr:S8 family serine peptidase [Candidatus Omnitrophota bacterium]MCG2703763.1 S8 family serine peptidase [Candidatus Omnitrophota bacterium]
MKSLRKNLVWCLAGFFILSFAGLSFGQQEKFFEQKAVKTIEGPKWAPGEIVVKFKKGVSGDVIREINQRQGCSVLSLSKRGGFKRLRIPRNKTLEEMVSVYSRNPNVEYAEPNFIASELTVPNDPYYSFQWNFDNPQYGGIHMESAWNIQTGNPGVIVAVIDTGVAYEDYGRKYKKAPDLANTAFVPGYDFVNNDSHPNDDEGHGTHVTGTIAQSTNNNLGVAGVAFNTSIMPIKVLNSAGSGTYADIAEGIYFAADNGANVINMSLGGTSPAITLENALAYAYNKNVTIVCAAGNEYQKGNSPAYPAAYDAYCIAVGATRFDETRSYYSNTGSYLDIAAPGGDLNVDQNNDGYGDGVLQQTFGSTSSAFGYYFYQGTSMAAPHVSGVAALLIANGTTGPANIKKALEATAEDKGPAGWDQEYGWGIVNAYAALNYTGEKSYDVAVTNISVPSWCLQGDKVSVKVSVANQGDVPESFSVTLTDTRTGTIIGNQPISLSAKATADLTFSWDTAGALIGEHDLQATASSVSGETETADNSLTTTVTVKLPVHDVAVIAMNAPLQANQGDIISIPVTVENQGTYAETTLVSLTDTKDGASIGSQSVSLNPGALTTVVFDWNTANASIGDHILKGEAGVVTGETDIADNSTQTTVTINEKSAAIMHVADIAMRLSTRAAGKNRFTKALATVTVVDANGNPEEGATVYGSWSNATSDTDTGVTDTAGKVTLESNEVKNARNGTTYVFSVDNIVKPDCIYEPAGNEETSDSITVVK